MLIPKFPTFVGGTRVLGSHEIDKRYRTFIGSIEGETAGGGVRRHEFRLYIYSRSNNNPRIGELLVESDGDRGTMSNRKKIKSMQAK